MFGVGLLFKKHYSTYSQCDSCGLEWLEHVIYVNYYEKK